MVKYGEGFFTSLGFAPLPPTFWERSLFTKPADRDVICHASAWDVDSKEDLRIKMCIQITEEDFRVIHHELGHNFYQRAYANQPPLFQSSANDGFHEAVGDTIALSVTPEYLKKIGLIETVPASSEDVDYLLQQALEKVAFLPFGLLVDKWRWEVFSGQVKPEEYNKAWWELVRKYQGVVPPHGAYGSGFRSRRKISRARKCAVHALFSGAHFAIPVSTRALSRSWILRAAASLLDLWQQGGRRYG